MKKISIFLVLTAVLLFSCNRSKKADKLSDTLVFDCAEFDTVAYLSDQEPSAKCEIKIRLFYAKGPNAHLINDSVLNSGILPEEELKRGAKKTIPRAVEIFARNYIKAYKKNFKQAKKDDPEFMVSEQEFTLSSSYGYGKDSIINYQADSYSYSGGAHGMTFSVALNFDAKTGRLLTIKDLLKSGSEDALCEKITANIAKQYNVSGLDGLKDNGIFDMFDPYIPDNYVFGKDTLTFIYEADEIGPHSYGQIKAKFAYKDISDLLK
ncbi:MAG: DUF3298 domain-containing protein [Bacteroidales bacterium]|nr:DUF3298 domain-containing protein [Bacteroidales bacterium]